MQNLRIIFVLLVSGAFLFFGCSTNSEEGSGNSSSSSENIGQNQSSSAGFNGDVSSSSVMGVESSSSDGNQTSSAGGTSSSSSSEAPVVSSSSTAPIEQKNFTETVGNASFDMVYIPGGEFTLGCDDDYRTARGISACPSNTSAVQATVSNYFIGKDRVRTALWQAVMGSNSGSPTSATWYQAHEFVCKLNEMTGKNYRMMTEAEFEYAAKNHLSSLEALSSTEEWAYNTWSATHSGGIDPIGPGGAIHNQKTRRNAQSMGDNITARLIRSIEGVGPALRLTLSADHKSFLPNYVPPCELKAPTLSGEPENSYRDPRWITGSNAIWTGLNLMVWEDGTAATVTTYNGRTFVTPGQWFTSNNISLVFVPTSSSGSRLAYAYIFLDDTQGSVIPIVSGGSSMAFTTRFTKEPVDHMDKPDISGGTMTGEALAKAQADFDTYFKMVDMENIPSSAREQDERLFDGPDHGWFQDNSPGAAHHYRKDIDPDEFRFTVSNGILANGNWFTVNNTFLRIEHPTGGYVAEYLYTLSSDGNTLYHNSFQGYERADFRMFRIRANTASFPCSGCENEISKGQSQTFYANQAIGRSTFVPAKCPAGGCK